MNINGLGLRAMDTVQLGSSRYGLNNYAFVISNWALSSDYGVVLQLREENADIYDDAASVVPVTPPTVSVPPTEVTTTTEAQTILRTTYPRYHDMVATDPGGGARITIQQRPSSPSAFFDYAGATGAVVVSGLPAVFNGLLYNTTYWAYADVDNIGDATPTYGVTNVYADSLNSSAHPMRVPLNQQITTPTAGGGSTSGGGSGGGYGGGGGGLTNFP
jgi:uncharacterized membrane protein YgcG